MSPSLPILVCLVCLLPCASGADGPWLQKAHELKDARDRLAVDIVGPDRPAGADAVATAIAAYAAARKPNEPQILYHRLAPSTPQAAGEYSADFLKACGGDPQHNQWQRDNVVYLVDKDLKCRGVFGYAPFTAKGWCADALTFTTKPIDLLKRAPFAENLVQLSFEVETTCDLINGYSWDQKGLRLPNCGPNELFAPPLSAAKAKAMQNSHAVVRPMPAGRVQFEEGCFLYVESAGRILAQDRLGERRFVLTPSGAAWQVASFAGYAFDPK